jgi:4-aminobutyrate aminotransferase-like enzyme
MPQYTGRRTTKDPYDLGREAARCLYPDVVVRGRRINRGTATVRVTAEVETPETAAVRRRQDERLLPTTTDATSPVVALDWPIHGPFVLSPHGTYFDAYHGVAQRVLDPHHPRFRRMVDDLVDLDLILRREIATDDYLALGPDSPAKTPADLGAAWDQAMKERWPRPGGYRLFLSASGAESIEAALKLSYLAAYKRFVERFGMATFREVAHALGAREVPYFQADPGLPDHPLYDDYPFQVVACEGAFHGRTLGALSLTWSKKAQRLGYPKPWNTHHVPYNAPGDPLRDLIDPRDVREILKVPGELSRVVREQRRIPKDLFAAFVAEPFQGEGGYVPGDPEFWRKARAVCDETGALLVADEVQSVGRTGRLFMMEHLGVRPDVVCTAKSMVLGITIAPAELSRLCHTGWHSNTWGAGRVLDTTFAWTTLDTLLKFPDPVFDGLSYLENEEIKGAQLSAGLDRLVAKHGAILVGHRGVGLMRGLLVRRRSDVIQAAWRHGLKLLGSGWTREVSVIRVLFLADTLAREVDAFLDVLDRTLTSLR